jgi:hypothetical protein
MAPVNRRTFLAGLLAAPVLVTVVKGQPDTMISRGPANRLDLGESNQIVFARSAPGYHFGKVCICGTFNGAPLVCDYHADAARKRLRC